jgi:hypothetical protein
MMEMTRLGELISLQRGYDLTETQRRPGTVPIVGSAGVHGYHENANAEGSKGIGVEGKQKHPSLLIVDGQQRLTSLYAVVSSKKKN